MSKFAKVGDYCLEKTCPDYGKVQSKEQHNIIKFGKTEAGRQRYKCNTCKVTFTERKGTIFHRRHTSEDEIIDTLALVAEGSRISSLARSKGHKEDTIIDWIREAGKHAEVIEEVLLANYKLSRGQIDGLWSYVGNKGQKKSYPETEQSGQFWRSTMIEIDTRLRVARGIAKTETQASIEVFESLKERGHPLGPPPTISDGWGGIREAILEVYGQVPPYSGRGRPPTKKQPQPGWQYLQVVKIRQNSRVTGTELRVIYGDKEEVLATLGISTSYIERTHLTMRHFNSRLVRKTLAFSKEVAMHKISAAWEDLVYNLVRPLKTLCLEVFDDPIRRWLPRTPAIVAGLTDHIWSVKELLTTLPIPP